MMINIAEKKIVQRVVIDNTFMGRKFNIACADSKVLLTPRSSDKNYEIYQFDPVNITFSQFSLKPGEDEAEQHEDDTSTIVKAHSPSRYGYHIWLTTHTDAQQHLYFIKVHRNDKVIIYKLNLYTKKFGQINAPGLNTTNVYGRRIKISNITDDLKYLLFHECFLQHEENNKFKWKSNIYIFDLDNNIVTKSSLPGPCSRAALDIVIARISPQHIILLVYGYMRICTQFMDILPVALVGVIIMFKMEEIVYFIDDIGKRYLQTNLRNILCNDSTTKKIM